ncbi:MULTISPECIES: MarR family winged helix-turn-helix transcriptional regulator [unclassified Marinobacter]|uniref:MarR family winged helix-turn-helix transcriptional regulator n=1 Tax=unclassified Marinobacter TaxID=83889 RepID=UPI0026E1ABF7|nr:MULTISPECIES: MarR family transcriptional regulator [unclassified Marinobacter]MDO6440586.1 MarR family transcriptional regulator [Marinobacter sp. 2_MG-2023]MDO6823414.1 MarR family transcriptional regulator [Marinobacter sp. 1_MG-2023]
MDDILALDNQICFSLYAANRAITSRYRPLLAELDLTYPQYLVMLVLWERARAGQVTRVSDLGARLRLDSGTLTPLLKRLALRGLILRERSVDDERVVTISLTGQGVDLRAHAAQVPQKLLCGLDVAPERLLALRDELNAVLRAIEAQEAVPSA